MITDQDVFMSGGAQRPGIETGAVESRCGAPGTRCGSITGSASGGAPHAPAQGPPIVYPDLDASYLTRPGQETRPYTGTAPVVSASGGGAGMLAALRAPSPFGVPWWVVLAAVGGVGAALGVYVAHRRAA